MALVPVLVACLFAGGSGWRIAAFGLFGVASLTDVLDGRLARQRGIITDFGKVADPIADKALTGSALVSLSLLGEVSWWVTGVIMLREVGVTGLRFWVIRHGVIAASRGGKAKTLLQVVAIGLYVLPGPFGLERRVAMAVAVVVTLVTGADYIARAMRLRQISRTEADCGVYGREGAGVTEEESGAAALLGQAPEAEEGDGPGSGQIAEQIIGLLGGRRQTVAVAESLTGGLLAAALTGIPGASAAFRGGIVAYATDLKAALLGVPASLLERRGAVHPDVAVAMAVGVRERLGVTFGVATTGVAGPDPADGQLPGTVHIAVSADQDTVVRTLALDGDRGQVRRLTVERSLGLLLGRLREDN